MTNSEFSNNFDTLLNSYASQAMFGEEAARTEIVLDEYEKSVILTNAQDIIVKSYFDRNTNSEGKGFDDSTKRQVDFSSLITTATLTKADDQSTVFDERGILYLLPRRNMGTQTDTFDGTFDNTFHAGEGYTTDVLFILNEKLIVAYGAIIEAHWYKEGKDSIDGAHTDAQAQELETCANVTDAKAHGWSWESEVWSKEGMNDVEGAETDVVAELLPKYATTEEAEVDGWNWADETRAHKKEYVIVPINYKEYDREMSKPYAQPLKKQAWRLFQNNTQGFDIKTELVPKWNLVANETIQYYKIRYIRRPCPIVLEDMPDGLSIDGYSKKQECELNPILHPEILQKAVEIAASTRGVVRPKDNA